MGIICRYPLRADVVHRNARFLSFTDARALKWIGQTVGTARRSSALAKSALIAGVEN